MIKSLMLLVFLWAGAASAMADEQIRRIQEELRKRNIYFGEIDGQRTPETSRALRAYQKRKGFKATGEPDSETLVALNLPPEPATAAVWPDVPVLKSDTARKIKDEERKLLEELPAIAEPPEVDRVRPSGPRKPSRANAPLITVPAPVEETAPVAADGKSRLSIERAEEFVRSYLDACETNELPAEMAFYADKVRYFDHGVVDSDFVGRDVAAFYKRWPKRSYHLYDLQVMGERGDETTVKFRIGFQYRSPKHRVAGKTQNYFTIQHAGDQMKFSALREERLRD